MKDKVIIFGGSGFLGSHVADALSDVGYDVIIYDIAKSTYIRPEQTMVIGDIMDAESVNRATEGCKYVFNYAGMADIDKAHFKPIETAKLNVLGTIHTLEAAKNAGAKRYVFASSVYVYSNQGSFYRSSKQSAEKFIETYKEIYDLDYSILRYGSLYGQRADETNGIYRLLKSALNDKKIIYSGTGDELREYIHVYDASKSSVQILDDRYANQHIILTGNEKLYARDLLKMIVEILGGKVEIEFQNQVMEGHYTITPYAFNPTVGRKLVNTYHIDMGQGLLDCLAELHKKFRPEVHSEQDWLVENNKNKSS